MWNIRYRIKGKTYPCERHEGMWEIGGLAYSTLNSLLDSN